MNETAYYTVVAAEHPGYHDLTVYSDRWQETLTARLRTSQIAEEIAALKAEGARDAASVMLEQVHG